MREMLNKWITNGILWGWNNLHKVVIAFFVIVLGSFIWSMWDGYQAHLAEKYRKMDQKYQQQLVLIQKDIDVLLKSREELKKKNTELAQDVEVWKKKAQATPKPPPVPAPPALEQAVFDMAQMGVEFKLSTPLPSQTATTSVANIPTIWTWSQESLRVKSLEVAYDNQVGLTTSLENRVNGLVSELGVADQAIAKYQEKDKVHEARTLTLQKNLTRAEKQVTSEKWKGNLKAGGAFILGVLLKGLL